MQLLSLEISQVPLRNNVCQLSRNIKKMVQFTKDAGNVCTTEWATHARGVRLACKSMVTVE